MQGIERSAVNCYFHLFREESADDAFCLSFCCLQVVVDEGANGKYKYYWLYRVKFGIPATNLATKGDGISFSTPTIEGTILCRNKLDAKGKHPWKAEVTEGDTSVSATTITNWYKEVYEPSYTNTASGGAD